MKNNKTNNLLKQNKGFSLIELIVTIAILTIVTTGTFVLANQNQKTNTRRLAQTIVSSMDSLRLDTMTKGGDKQYIHLFKKEDNGGIYMQISNNPVVNKADIALSKKIASNIPIIYKKEGDIKGKLSSTNSITISFVRSTGAFHNDNYYKYIELGYSGGKQVTIKCIKITGRYYIE